MWFIKLHLFCLITLLQSANEDVSILMILLIVAMIDFFVQRAGTGLAKLNAH